MNKLYLQVVFLFLTRSLVANQNYGRSAAQLKHVPISTDEMTELLWERFCSVGTNVSNKDNFYHSLFMRGLRSELSPTPDHLIPPYLTKTGFDKLKVNHTIVLHVNLHMSTAFKFGVTWG